MSRITVLLAEDHAMVREGLSALLALEEDIEIIAEAANGRETVEMTQRLRPNVIVMDIAMPLLNGLEATRQILRGNPEARVIILSAHSDDGYIEEVMAMGAAGYLVKHSPAHMLIKAVRRVHAGHTFYSPSIAKRLKDQKDQSEARGGTDGKKRRAAHMLTSREMEVLQLIAEGKANKETAEELGISVKTVEKHRQSLMRKLNIHDTASLTRYAIGQGVIESTAQITIE